jgi:iron complex outermembrane receptor protein
MGYKASYLENRLKIALNYYQTQYDGKQFTGNVPVDSRNAQEFDRESGGLVDVVQIVTIWGTQNFGKQEMSGLEFEFDYIPYEGGKLSGWVTQMDSEVTSDFITQWYYGQDAQFGRPDYGGSIANVPENAVNLKGNETPYSPNLAFTIRYEHTFNLGTMGTLAPSVNYHWQAEDYLTIWNADKHVNDPGGYGTGVGESFVDLPGYFADSVDEFGDQRGSWDMIDLTLTYKPAGESNYYVQAYAYNVTDEEVAWFRGVEAGNPRGSYSAPSQYGIRIGYFW